MHQGFEVGVHTYDHVKWQDGVANASLDWTREQLRLAVRAFEDDLRLLRRRCTAPPAGR